MTELKLQQCRLDGRYDLQDCLGRGSYSEIYIARDIAATNGSPTTVVIKALNVFLQGDVDNELERTLVENFQNEAVALDRVRHPNIISRLGHGTAIDLANRTFHYIVLEYLSGGDMSAMCKRQALEFENALFYLEQVCTGLAHAHGLGVIHRDIKPQNLLLTEDRQVVKIADFGVARLEASEGVITRVGTNVYAAPEHNPLVQTGALDAAGFSAALFRTLTPAADVYSLAKTVYTLIAGEAPRRFCHGPITELPASLGNRSWSSSVLAVLQRATQTSPLARYQNVQEFWADLVDASLPPTRLLNPLSDVEGREHVSAELTRAPELELTADLPQLPVFDQSPVMEQSRAYAGGSGQGARVRPRIVVPVVPEFGQDLPADMGRKRAHDIIASMPDLPDPQREQPARSTPRVARRSTRLLVAAFLILAFAGMLFAFRSYVRSHWAKPAPAPVSSSSTVNPVGYEGTIIITDVKLRADAGTNNPEVGIAEQGSRVHVLNIKDNWCEVQVLQHARAKSDPASADRGWINRRYLKLD
jgi:serine/threonine protein kinase